MSVLLSKPLFGGISQKELVQQLSGIKKAELKLPSWFKTRGIYYPTTVKLEQTSSEITGAYKARLVRGNRMADLTGGFGVDTYFFSRVVPHMTHCELDRELHEIASHNSKIMGNSRVEFRCEDGIEFLRNSDQRFDWIFLDPGRRDASRNKVFLLSDCQPDVSLHLDLLLEKSEHTMIKTSPLLDLTAGISELKAVKEIHVVAVDNEVRELLWILERNSLPEHIRVRTVNLAKSGEQRYDFLWPDERESNVTCSPPLQYLYEPNSAILKAGAFRILCRDFGIEKLHEHSHLYTSEKRISFPGRTFRIEKVYPYSKRQLRELKGLKANVSTRNFPQSVAQIRKQFGIGDGGSVYLFFTTNNSGKRIVIQCTKEPTKDTAI